MGEERERREGEKGHTMELFWWRPMHIYMLDITIHLVL